MSDNSPELENRSSSQSPIRALNTKYEIRNTQSVLGWRTHLLVLAGFSFLTFFMTLPLPLELGAKVPGGGDAWQHIWNLWWVKDSVLNGQNPYHTTLLYYPDGVNLYFHTLVLTAGLIGIPLQLLGLNLIATYNLIVLSSFVLAGYSMFLLCHYLTGHKWAAVVGGIVFAYAPYHFAHVYGHMNLISIQWMPFYVLLLLKAIDTPEVVRQKAGDRGQESGASSQPNSARSTQHAALRYAAGAGVLLAVNAYTDWTYAAYLLLLTALVILWRALRRSERQSLREHGVGWRQGVVRLLVGIGVFTLLVSPVLFPTLAEAQLGYAQQEGYETLVYSSDVVLAFTPSELHPIWGPGIKENIDKLGPYLPVKNPSERTLFLGYTVLLLAIYAVWRLRKVGQVRFWAFAALVTWVLSLGPVLQLNGETAFTGFKVTYPLPYLLLFDLPFFSIMRSPSRLTVLTMMALAILSAYAVASLLRRFGARDEGRKANDEEGVIGSKRFGGPISNRGSLVGKAIVGIVIPALILFEFMATLDLVPPGWDVPVYSKIAAEPEQFALLELPLRPFGDFMAYQTVHGKPIVGGYLSRQPPYPTRDNTPVLQYLKPTTDPADPLREQVGGDTGVQTLRELGVKYVIIRWWAFDVPAREAMEAKLKTVMDNRPPDYRYKKDQVDVWQLYP